MKQKSAKRTKLVNNIIVHIVLAVLAAVWVFPVLWVIMTLSLIHISEPTRR